MKSIDVVVVGAGAAGLMCAIEAGKRGRSVLVLDHANRPGKKILMSGGGRCNFTNYDIRPACYLSHNPDFCKSALNRFTQWDFIELVRQYHIPFHEKTLGQLFCDNKSSDILEMLLTECEKSRVEIRLKTEIESIKNPATHEFYIKTAHEDIQACSVVIASGGLSIPTMGASPFGYKIAEQFGIKVWPTRAGLVPLTLHDAEKERLSVLSGVSVDAIAGNDKIEFRENVLFTHRGLSGPAILQLSSYWQSGEGILLNILPEVDVATLLKETHRIQSNKQVNTVLSSLLPRRVIDTLLDPALAERKMGSISYQAMTDIGQQFNQWRIVPNGTEGYRTAEVTLGGVDCHALSSKTMEAVSVPGLYFIGEAVDVTGWLGGYNFQWAWSSGWAAGQYV